MQKGVVGCCHFVSACVAMQREMTLNKEGAELGGRSLWRLPWDSSFVVFPPPGAVWGWGGIVFVYMCLWICVWVCVHVEARGWHLCLSWLLFHRMFCSVSR